MLWGHDPARPIGRWLEVREDDVGLYVRGQCNLDTTAGKDAHSHLANGDATGMSVGFRIPEGGSKWEGGVNLLSQIDLREVSVVTMPANDRARVTSKADLVDLLTKSGLPRAAAAKVAAGGFAALTHNDDDEIGALVSAIKASALNIRNA